jgi:hypothetical protein
MALCLSEAEYWAACRSAGAKSYSRWILNDHSHATLHWVDCDGGLTAIVCLRGWEGRNPIEVAGLLVHEAVHIWQGYAGHIGEKFEGSEQEAYAIQCISQELLAEFARRM